MPPATEAGAWSIGFRTGEARPAAADARGAPGHRRHVDPVRCSPFLGQLVAPPAHRFHDPLHGLRHHVVGVRETPSTSDLSFPSSPTTVFAPFSQSKLGGPVENPRFVSWSNACRRSPLLKNRRVRGRRTPCDGAGVGVSVPALRDSGWHRAGTPPVPCPANRLARRNRRCSPGSSDLFFELTRRRPRAPTLIAKVARPSVGPSQGTESSSSQIIPGG